MGGLYSTNQVKYIVVNLLDDTVSVIYGENNTKIGKDIPVGNNPSDIGVNQETNTIYVVNQNDVLFQ